MLLTQWDCTVVIKPLRTILLYIFIIPDNGKQMKSYAIIALVVLSSLATMKPLFAQDRNNSTAKPTIALVAPLSGAFHPLGQQLLSGAEMAMSNQPFLLLDDACSAEGGKIAAQKIIENNIKLATGFLCSEALEAALPTLNQHNIPIIAVGVPELTLYEVRNPNRYSAIRLSLGSEREAHAIALFLAQLWQNKPVAIIEDGTIEGREIAAKVNAEMRMLGLVPVFTDTFRPGLENQNALIARLKKSGATHIFIGGQRDDIAAIGHSAKAMNYDVKIAAGSQLNAAKTNPDIVEGTIMIAPLQLSDQPSAKNIVEQLQQKQILPEDLTLLSYAAMEIALQAFNKSKKENLPVRDALTSQIFQTAIGTFQFDQTGQRRDNPYKVQIFDGKSFKPYKS